MLSLLKEGEKYATIGLAVAMECFAPLIEIRLGFWAWRNEETLVDDLWREWLGSIRVEEFQACNLFLLCKLQSSEPEVLNFENQRLQQRVNAFYTALLLVSAFTPAHPPILLTGACAHGEAGIRQFSTLNAPSLNVFRHYVPITLHDIERAATLAECYETMIAKAPKGGAWRIHRALAVYVSARTMSNPMDRLHQYCRCIDGLIFSEQGNGKRQFKSRTELFIGPCHHRLMEQLYAIRSDIEHLNEHKYLEIFDRGQRLDLVEKEAIADHIARHVLSHIIGNESLWEHFGNADGLGKFWKLPSEQKERMWGPAVIRPEDALRGYCPSEISDGALGMS